MSDKIKVMLDDLKNCTISGQPNLGVRVNKKYLIFDIEKELSNHEALQKRYEGSQRSLKECLSQLKEQKTEIGWSDTYCNLYEKACIGTVCGASTEWQNCSHNKETCSHPVGCQCHWDKNKHCDKDSCCFYKIKNTDTECKPHEVITVGAVKCTKCGKLFENNV